MSEPDPELRRRLSTAHEASRVVASDDDAEQLYLHAATVAEQRIVAPLGSALAGVLAHAAEIRRLKEAGGSLGEPHTMLALAVAVNAMEDLGPRRVCQ